MGSSDRSLPRVTARCRGTGSLTAAVVGVLLVAAACTTVTATARSASASPSPTPTHDASRQAPRGGWSWPLHPVPAVVRPFEAPPQPWAAGHRGVDLAAAGTGQVRAPADGVVAFAGSVAGRGVLSIDHPGGLRTTYEPVTATVGPGDTVTRGQPVATVAGTRQGHCAAVTCLHWGARRGSTYLDPLTLVASARPPVLLPLDGHGPGPSGSTVRPGRGRPLPAPQ